MGQQSKDDDFYIQQQQQQQNKKEEKEKGGYKALVGTKLIPAKQLESSSTPEEKKTLGELLQEADDILAQPYQEPPVEDIFIDGKSHFSIKSHNPWDCETILTTYSNVDNHPTTIGRSNNKKKNNKPQIQLSNK